MKNPLVVIHQPDFMPYLGFFHRLLIADCYVVLDNVQFVYGSRSWTSRDKIKTAAGTKWLTVPVEKCPQHTNICDVFIKNELNWKERHLNLLWENYRRAAGFTEVFPYVENLYQLSCERLMDFNMCSIQMLMDLLGISTQICFSSQIAGHGKSNMLLADILKKVGSSRYLSGVGAKDYYDPAVYEDAKIEVIWQEFQHPVYPQQFGGFIPYLSSIDLLLNCGIEASRKILRSTIV